MPRKTIELWDERERNLKAYHKSFFKDSRFHTRIITDGVYNYALNGGIV